MERDRKFMTDEIWNIILNKYIIPYRFINSFSPPTFIGHKDGEPLLNKKFFDRLTSLSNACPDIKIDIYSHGLMLPILAKQGKDLFQFLSGLPNQIRYLMSYHPYNHDGSENNYDSTFTYLYKILKYSKPSNVEFISVSHKSKWVNEEKQQEWKCQWEGLPITVHCNASLNPWTGRIQEEGTTRFNGCPYGDFGHWFFGVTGNVIACCLDLEEEIVLGNVLTHDPQEMFDKTNQFYIEQRRTQEEKRRPAYEVCYNCYGYDREEKKDLLQIGLAIK